MCSVTFPASGDIFLFHVSARPSLLFTELLAAPQELFLYPQCNGAELLGCIGLIGQMRLHADCAFLFSSALVVAGITGLWLFNSAEAFSDLFLKS